MNNRAGRVAESHVVNTESWAYMNRLPSVMDTHGFFSEAPISPVTVKIVTDDALECSICHLSLCFRCSYQLPSAVHVSFLVHASPCAMLISPYHSCVLHPTLRTSRVELCIYASCPATHLPSQYHLWHHWTPQDIPLPSASSDLRPQWLFVP